MSVFNPIKVVTRAIGIPDKVANAIFPIGLVSDVAGRSITGLVGRQFGAAQPSQSVSQAPAPTNFTLQYPSGPYQSAPAYYGGQYYVPPSGSYLGGDQWGYSTYFPQTPAPATYYPRVYQPSVSAGPPIWEDLLTEGLTSAFL